MRRRAPRCPKPRFWSAQARPLVAVSFLHTSSALSRTLIASEESFLATTARCQRPGARGKQGALDAVDQELGGLGAAASYRGKDVSGWDFLL